jgi:ribosomal-protein-alanine N-acetyltransferase
VIRAATARDVDGLAALEATLFAASAWSHRAIEEEVTRGRVEVVDDGHGVTAYVVVALSGEVTDLLRIGVRPDHQRRGLAGIMLTGVLERAEGERVMLEVSDANAAALALYRGHGFEVLDRRRGYYPDGSDALVMSRSLS